MSGKSQKTTRPHPLVMKVAGGLIKHLGLQMYSGPVPSIAELIANSWDAMASTVKVSIPIGRTIKSNDEISVEDDGHGMTYEEANEQYLLVGRDRRTEGDMTKVYKKVKSRKVLGRKGIGKLAGFGIANVVEIRTIKNGEITNFRLDFEKITKDGYIKEYEPELLAEDGLQTKESDGTRIILKNLKITRPIDEAQFKVSLARRFGILSDPNFSVLVNEQLVQKNEMDFQFRFPEKKGEWNSERIKGKDMKWWIGFTKKPIADDEARGIVVFARGKLVQAPCFFDLSGGAEGQHGMQYMTGEVQADFLDETGGVDLIATDRASVMWDEEPAATLRVWGQSKVKELLKKWAEARRKEREVRPEVKKYLELGKRLPDRERQIFVQYVEKIVSIPQVDEDNVLDELVQFGFNALTNNHFLEVIKQINAASPTDRDKIVDVLSEWDIIEAVSVAQQVKGRVEIINKFEEMIDSGVPEKPDMQDYLKEHPWLLDPAWSPFHHEKQFDTLLGTHFGLTKTKSKEGRRRPDYFCLAAATECEVIDLKRPGVKVSMKELQQIEEYVLFLIDESKKTTHSQYKINHTGGMLIYSDIDSGHGVDSKIDALEKEGIHVMRWGDVLRRTKNLHEDFLKAMKKKVPSNDPRMKALESIGKGNSAKANIAVGEITVAN